MYCLLFIHTNCISQSISRQSRKGTQITGQLAWRQHYTVLVGPVSPNRVQSAVKTTKLALQRTSLGLTKNFNLTQVTAIPKVAFCMTSHSTSDFGRAGNIKSLHTRRFCTALTTFR